MEFGKWNLELADKGKQQSQRSMPYSIYYGITITERERGNKPKREKNRPSAPMTSDEY
jgi:hypothetical protein